MGVIKKTLFRGQLLGKPRHRNLFLDMEENIHIHYRDLRIEMSRGEFEDFVDTFAKQSEELGAIIQENNYQDGKLANTNQEDVRIWTESRLQHPVKYHPQRFSLEECGDGYHFHYRNLKILIDKEEFRQLTRVFKGLDLDAPYASSYSEVMQLLDDNEVDYVLAMGNLPGEVLCIAAAQYHLPKIRDIFKYIGFEADDSTSGEKHYVGSALRVIVRADKRRNVLDYRRMRGNKSVLPLVDYLSIQGESINPDELNQLKCQVLDLYYSLHAGQTCQVDIDPLAWLYAPDNGQVIFPYSSQQQAGKVSAEKLYRAWSTLLKELNLSFIKPVKRLFSPEVQERLTEAVLAKLRQDVAAYAAVSKIHLMGSALREDMGCYDSPFVLGKLAKLGSDIDILIEIDPTLEDDLPANWSFYVDRASNQCAIYHIGEIALSEDWSQWAQRYPNIPFTHHLLDAYVHLPSRGCEKEKDAFLAKFKVQLFYDRERDGILYRGDEEQSIASSLQTLHGFKDVAVEPMKVSTENVLYKVFADKQAWVLKLFKVSGNYSSSRIAEHTDYEEKLVEQLMARGVSSARILHAPEGIDSRIQGLPALLFERLPGKVNQRPEYPLEKICAVFAKIHCVQMQQALILNESFTFDDTCMIWLPTFERYQKNEQHSPDIAKAFDQLAPFAESCYPGDIRSLLYARSPHLHNHGDVTPKNVIVADTGDTWFFDFNNAFFGPRIVDVIDGAYEFSLAEKYIHLADFSRFDQFISHYASHNPLSQEEQEDLPKWINLVGLIKFTKEVRVFLERPQQSLRRKRALAIAEFMCSRAAML